MPSTTNVINANAELSAIFYNDPAFGKKYQLVAKSVSLPKYGGESTVHPDLIPFPNHPRKVVMAYTPEHPNTSENMCLVYASLENLKKWSPQLWSNPLISYDSKIPWKQKHLSDFCLLYVPETQKWWTWFSPAGSPEYGCQIAYGLSHDGIEWCDDFPENPVFRANREQNNWEYDFVRAPSVLWNRRTQKFEMFYDNLDSGWVKPARLCRAESTDGIHWSNRAIIYDPQINDESTNAIHPCVRYFAGQYWCWFPKYYGDLWLMVSKTGLPGDWSEPTMVIPRKRVWGSTIYRVGVLIDSEYKIHVMVSYFGRSYKTNFHQRYLIAYFISELSPVGKEALHKSNQQINDFDFGGSIINNYL